MRFVKLAFRQKFFAFGLKGIVAAKLDEVAG